MDTNIDLYAYGGDAVIACSIVFMIFCTIALALRILARLRAQSGKPGLEDWLMIPAWVLIIGFAVTNIVGVKVGGLGRHSAYLLKFEPEKMSIWPQVLLASIIFYGTILAIIKTSILLLYIRLFGIHRWFRFTTYGFIAYIWAWSLSEILVAIFQCKPVHFQWDKSIAGSCINQLAFFRWISVPNVIHDVAMLILPVPVVWNLHMPLKKRLALSSVFLVGTIGCIASFIRLSIFWKKDALVDPTWTSIQLSSWTLAEPAVIFICACLPLLWPLISPLLRKTSTTKRNTSHEMQSPSPEENALVHSLENRTMDARGPPSSSDSKRDANLASPIGIQVTKPFAYTISEPRNVV